MRRFLNFVNVFSLFVAISPLEKGGTLFVIISPWKGAGPFIWTNLSPHHPRMFCAKFSWKWPSGSGEEDFKISSMYFTSPWKGAGPFNWTKSNPLYQRMLCAKFGWNQPSGSGEEDKIWKVYDDDNDDDNGDGQRTNFDKKSSSLSFGLRWAKKILVRPYER